METFFVDAQLAALELPARRELVKLLVDSGSTYTWVTAATLVNSLAVARHSPLFLGWVD